MSTRLRSLLSNLAARSRRSVARLVRRFGFVLLPISTIERMDYEGRCAYAAMKKPERTERDIGYFNGLADCYSRTAHDLRERHLT
jgi:hypothetical protein